jgi:beta-glucosidase
MSQKYSMSSTLKELLESPGVQPFLEKYAPGFSDNPAIAYVMDMPMERLIGGMPDQADLFKALVDAANGEEVTYVPQDPKKIAPRLSGGAMGGGTSEEVPYDVDDVDGKMYMLDHRFSGCIVLRFSKEMREDVYGSVTYEGKELKRGVIAQVDVAGGMQMFGVYVRDVCTDYDKKYTLHVEGFEDTDGNKMEPADVVVHTLPKPEVDPAYEAHDAVALEAAREGIVLLKNEGNVLPLAPDLEVEVVGAGDFRVGAVGAGKINPRYSMGLKRALEERSGFVVKEGARAGIFVISRASGENYDNNALKGEYYLTDEEEAQLKSMTGRCEKVVVVVNSGYPIDMRWVEKYQVLAVIWCGFPGMLGGQALVEILDGRVNPSGKLADTWSWDYFDIPASANFYRAPEGEQALSADCGLFVDTFYEEDIYVGYRYFETFEKPVAFAFGHGLSYTTFSIEAALSFDETSVSSSGEGALSGSDGTFATVCAKVKNTGDRAGKEVVQVYARIPDGKLEQPAKRLVGFAKTKELAPGETQELEIVITEKSMASFDTERASWIVEAGTYAFYVGNAVDAVDVCGECNAEEERVLLVSENLMKLPVEMGLLSKKNPEFPKGAKSGLKREYTCLTPKAERKHYPETEWNMAEAGEGRVDKARRLAADLSIRELARLSVCASHGWGMHETGEAGKIYRLEGRDLPRYAVADGNNGVNINKPNIGMPCSNTVCSTWNTDLAFEVGRVIGEEARENDIRMILAPAMNIHRNPLNGRHPEYFSEDPLLGGIMAGNQCKGLHAAGVDSSMKHTVANNAESSRKRNHSFISERALREIYLKIFEYAIGVQEPTSIMTGYNACNGCFTAEDEEMIQGIFHKEFGFDGYVMTDWNSYDTADVASAVRAGNCWMTPGTTDDTYVQPIIDGVESGYIEEARLRKNVCRILEAVV